MKITILTASFLLLLAGALPVYAAQEHHPATDAPTAQEAGKKAEPAAQTDTAKMDSAMAEMQQTCKKMQEATSSTERETFMQQHMQQMKDGMKMMDMMGTSGMKQQGEKDEMMEKKMHMMMQMMGQMMTQQEMMMKK